MMDVHTHVLPGMDDGSRSLADSLKLLQLSADQGTELLVATPHFNLQKETLSAFLQRRDDALEKLAAATAGQDLPRVIAGAEVRYVPQLLDCGGLDRLCLGAGNALLLELPMAPWSRPTLDGIYDMIRTSGITVVIAHAERYARMQTRKDMATLFAMGALMQADAEFFLTATTRIQALSMLRRGRIHLVASDCHDPETRPPNLGPALALIARRLGPQAVQRLEYRGAALLQIGGEEGRGPEA